MENFASIENDPFIIDCRLQLAALDNCDHLDDFTKAAVADCITTQITIYTETHYS